MAKALTILGMIVAGLTTVAFGMDLVLGFPFNGANTMIDIGFVVCGLVMGYLSWNAFQEAS